MSFDIQEGIDAVKGQLRKLRLFKKKERASPYQSDVDEDATYNDEFRSCEENVEFKLQALGQRHTNNNHLLLGDEMPPSPIVADFETKSDDAPEKFHHPKLTLSAPKKSHFK